jgi:hypothetical protein
MLDTEEIYWKVREYTDEAKGIAFDTCHKIYIMMDDEQVALQKSYGYGEEDPNALATSDQLNPAEMATVITTWFQNSCGLRFISAVSTNPSFGDDGWVHVISQFEADEDEDEDDE